MGEDLTAAQVLLAAHDFRMLSDLDRGCICVLGRGHGHVCGRDHAYARARGHDVREDVFRESGHWHVSVVNDLHASGRDHDRVHDERAQRLRGQQC